MLKLLKNLKNSWVSVLTIVILLCIQAAADLALPDYTSKIVNVGIQYGGIEEAAPEVILEEEMENLLIFTENDEQILSNYDLVSDSPNHEQEKKINKFLGENYNIEENEVYVLKNLEEEELNNLVGLISEPLVEYNAVMNEVAAGYISQMTDSVKEQAAISAVREFYADMGVDTDKLQNDYILMSGLQMLGIALISMISAVSIMLLSSRVAAKLGKILRDKVFKKVLSFSTAELREFSTASLITRSTNDVQQIQQLISMLFRVVVYAPIIGIGGFIKVLTTSDNSMAWIIGVAIFAILVVVATLFAVAMPKFRKLQDLIDKLNQVSREILTGLPVIRAFNTEKKEEKRFDESNTLLMKANVFVNRAMSMMMPLLMFIMSSITVLIVWVGAHNVDSGTMQVGDMMAFIQYTMQIVMAFLMISLISIMLPRASVSAKRINEVIETEPSIKDKEETKTFRPRKERIGRI